MIKQADVVLAMFLLGHEFSPEQKKRNFDYYDQLTTGDSSLSACIQSIVAVEIGYDELALRYLMNALLMDLADVGGNVKDGCHIASMGGTWMGVVYGLAGLRDYGGRLSFHPNKQVRDLRFHLTVRGQLLAVEIKTRRRDVQPGTGRRSDGLPQGRTVGSAAGGTGPADLSASAAVCAHGDEPARESRAPMRSAPSLSHIRAARHAASTRRDYSDT